MEAECQVCGRPAAGEGTVEGARVPLCETCSAYSSNFSFSREYEDFMLEKERKTSKPKYYGSTSTSASTPGSASKQSAPAAKKPAGEGELLEDYGKKIMQARERQKLSRKELARKLLIQEKELEGFEQQKYKPSQAAIKKLEFALGISLIESQE